MNQNSAHLNINLSQPAAVNININPSALNQNRPFPQININIGQLDALNRVRNQLLPELGSPSQQHCCPRKACFGQNDQLHQLLQQMAQLLGRVSAQRDALAPQTCGPALSKPSCSNQGAPPAATTRPSSVLPQRKESTQRLRELFAKLFNPAKGPRAATIQGGRGDDKLKVRGAKFTRVHGGPGDDKIKFRPGPNSKRALITGGRGDDKLNVKGTKFTRVRGGPGNDRVIFTPGQDTQRAKLSGGKGRDTLVIKGDFPYRLTNSGPKISIDGFEKIVLKGKPNSTLV